MPFDALTSCETVYLLFSKGKSVKIANIVL